MKKLFTVLFTVIAAVCFGLGVAACSHSHTWVATDEVDANGFTVYKCDCGEIHEHTFDTSKYVSVDSDYHGHASNCEHTGLYIDKAAHTFEDGVCTVCGYKYSGEVEVLFSYYTDDDEDGTYGSDDDTYRAVTYTPVDGDGYETIEDVEGGSNYFYAGEKIAFTVTKSVFASYTDTRDYPLVYANDVAITPDSDGVYIVTLTEDTVITVGNVETDSPTITGSGTESNPYTINSLIDWLYFAYMVNDKDWYGISYNIGYWKLTCDLDFGGESIYIVGDGYSSSYSMFMGNFDGDGHTLSNFVIDNAVYGYDDEYSTYVGVFGVMSGYAGVDTCIKNLTIENYTVEAGATADSAVAVGGLVGMVSGASVINCHVENCTFEVNADDDYPAYIGGVVGICQSGYNEDMAIIFYSSIQYCSVDVDISGTGYIYETGGIVARCIPYGSIAPIFIFNNYSAGTYSGARSGGIVGYAGRYTSVQNCYSTASVYASSTESLGEFVTGYAGTALDDRYAYAGGIVGYAENDVIVSCCFYQEGTLSATSTADSSFASTGDIIGGASEAGFEDYRALAAVEVNNLTRSDTVTNSVLQSTLGWSDADWTFGNGYPTINTAETSREFTITINISGTTTTYKINSVYMPMSYWFVTESSGTNTDSESNKGIPQYLSSGTNRTYGYYFDAALTQRVPDSYVPMGDITLYAGYADYSEVAGEYLIYANGITVTLILSDDGTYSFDQGAIYLTGDYEYNGEYITMAESYFSRFASNATTTQQETYFTFWAEVNSNGDLEIYDCETLREVESSYDEYGYTLYARMITKSSPLVAMTAAHAEICGNYYTSSGEVYAFEAGYTGTFSTNSFTYAYDSNGTLTVTMENGQKYTATIVDGKITALTRNNNTISLTAFDDFCGSWEQSATIDKSYTFDGMGGWEYYVNGVEVDYGDYTVNANNELTFTRGTVSVTVTINKDGTLNVKESTGSVGVTYYGAGGYQGTWYTAANQTYRYTLTLSGLDSDGVGIITLTGTGVSISDLRYINSNGTLYAYDGDDLYATLTYDSTTALMTGDFDGTTYVFYLYDNFKGDWFSSISGLEKITFNGLGAYNDSATYELDDDGNRVYTSIAVYGNVTINGGSKVKYAYNTSGELQFTYNNVTYTMVYDENSNEVTLTYNGTTGKLIAGDTLYGVTYYDGDGVTYEFDGAGNLDDGGTVEVTTASGALNYTYVITNGVVTIYSDYTAKTVFATATPVYDADGEVTGYSFVKNGTASTLLVQNDYTGTWVIVGGYAKYEIPEIAYYEADSTIELTVYYTSGNYTHVPMAAYYDGSTLWIEYDPTLTYYMNYGAGYMLYSSTYAAKDDDDCMYMTEDDGYLKTYENGDNSVKLGGDSTFIDYDNFGDVIVTIDKVEYDYIYKVDAIGNITIYEEVENEDGDYEFVAVYTFNVVTQSESAYECDGEYRALVAAES